MSWEERFDKRFGFHGGVYNYDMQDKIKSFIRTLLEEEQKKSIDQEFMRTNKLLEIHDNEVKSQCADELEAVAEESEPDVYLFIHNLVKKLRGDDETTD